MQLAGNREWAYFAANKGLVLQNASSASSLLAFFLTPTFPFQCFRLKWWRISWYFFKINQNSQIILTIESIESKSNIICVVHCNEDERENITNIWSRTSEISQQHNIFHTHIHVNSSRSLQKQRSAPWNVPKVTCVFLTVNYQYMKQMRIFLWLLDYYSC